jgi:D-xylose transport system permease protein
MVFVIVARHIDLSVGSMLAMCSAVMAMCRPAGSFRRRSGLRQSQPSCPVTICRVADPRHGCMGALTGWLVGYQRIPSFIVTLGGLLIWRNRRLVRDTNGQSVALTDPNLLMFGGSEGVLGATISWTLGADRLGLPSSGRAESRRAATSNATASWSSRSGPKPLIAGLIVGAILGFIGYLFATDPRAQAEAPVRGPGRGDAEGYVAMHGLPISVLILIVVAS